MIAREAAAVAYGIYNIILLARGNKTANRSRASTAVVWRGGHRCVRFVGSGSSANNNYVSVFNARIVRHNRVAP